MATEIIPGQIHWSLTRDSKGHREYTVRHKVRCTASDGPGAALLTPGIPLPGSPWVFDNDADFWAFCKQDAKVTPTIDDHSGNTQYIVEQIFSTKPDLKQCQEEQFEDPLLQPQKVSGTFVKYTEENHYNRDGSPIVTSSFELLRGAIVEFDRNRPQIRIEQNVAVLDFALCAALVDTVNSSILWGLPPRTIKLSSFDWERKFYGTCYYYYTRIFTFDIRADGFDRSALDEGSKALRGRWDKRPTSPTYKQYVLAPGVDYENGGYLNPANFIRYKDWNGENAKTLLNGRGRPYDTGAIAEDSTGSGTGTGDDRTIGVIPIEVYQEGDFLLLGIPTDF